MKTRSLYFENRKEYYRLKESGFEYKIRVPTTYNLYKTYFVNFEILESRGYVVGSLSSPRKIPFNEAKSIIKSNLPNGYTAINFYEAISNDKQNSTKFVLMREGNEIWEGNIYV